MSIFVTLIEICKVLIDYKRILNEKIEANT